MADDKKNIGPEVETPAEAPVPEQPAPDKPEPIIGDPAPAELTVPIEKAESAVPEALVRLRLKNLRLASKPSRRPSPLRAPRPRLPLAKWWILPPPARKRQRIRPR